jgi:hypothetical protein
MAQVDISQAHVGEPRLETRVAVQCLQSCLELRLVECWPQTFKQSRMAHLGRVVLRLKSPNLNSIDDQFRKPAPLRYRRTPTLSKGNVQIRLTGTRILLCSRCHNCLGTITGTRRASHNGSTQASSTRLSAHRATIRTREGPLFDVCLTKQEKWHHAKSRLYLSRHLINNSGAVAACRDFQST